MKQHRTYTKLFSLFLAVLMVLGACPIVLAADGDIVTKWPTAEREVEYGQKYCDAGLVGGEAAIPGEFVYVSTTAKPSAIGEKSRDIQFVPADTTVAPVSGTVVVNVIQSKSAVLEGGIPTASSIKVGQMLSDSIIDKSDIKFVNYGAEVSNWKCRWKETDKVMDTAGTYTETIECYPGLSSYQKKIASIWIDIEIVVEAGEVEYVPEITVLPTASNIKVGQTLADSNLTGGKVMKGDVEIPGTFAWKDSTIAPAIGTPSYDVVFTPADPAACDPIETKVRLTVEKLDVEITWPEVKGQYKANAVVKDCVTLTGGEANIEGEFRITEKSKYMRIPASITESMDIELVFLPKDDVNYVKQNKTVTVSFEPAMPDCKVTLNKLSETQMEIYAFINNEENWDLKTGKLYFVIDGDRIELDEPSKRFVYDFSSIAAGTHTVQTVYEAGENDVYVSDKSDVREFTTQALYAVNVTDYNGTNTVGSYLPGKTVTVTAQPHEKSYYDFTGWTAEGITLTEEESAQQTLTFEMPENEVNLTANYKFNFCNFVKAVFEKIGQVLLGIINQGIAWLKDAIQNIPRP